MSARKAVVERYFEGWRRLDHEQILACLTEDVVWNIVGYRHLEGLASYDAEIENPEFVGAPHLEVDRVVEEGDVVVATGTGAATRADGGRFHFAFCDVFVFSGELVRRRESYVVPLTPGV
ncbi:MAG TPA: nuclear transport factor 2 family protein [Acidimicrobiales bacterium]|nr:nuclear transport factor 2 family protein [Acidimicrobiales bacterium]